MTLPEKFAGKTWKTVDGSLDHNLMAKVLDAIWTDKSIKAATGIPDLQDRRLDRALQLLKKEGLIHFDKTRRRWCRGPG